MSKELASAFALSAAALFLASCEKSGAATNAPGSESVECMGANECKGQGACDVAGKHKCAGENECKGKGWIQIPKSECDAKGGSARE